MYVYKLNTYTCVRARVRSSHVWPYTSGKLQMHCTKRCLNCRNGFHCLSISFPSITGIAQMKRDIKDPSGCSKSRPLHGGRRAFKALLFKGEETVMANTKKNWFFYRGNFEMFRLLTVNFDMFCCFVRAKKRLEISSLTQINLRRKCWLNLDLTKLNN